MRLKRIFLYLSLILPLFSFSQTVVLKNISGLPTREVYDLMTDSKGFLWIGHDLGLTRYDGTNFVSYSHPGQTSLSQTDLVEDNKGRIWSHNFTGQIFYIENDTIHLLKAYDYKSESTFPRIAILKNKLIATTDKGIFVCNTDNLKCSYIKCMNAPGKGTYSLAVISNRVLAFNDINWFTFDGDKTLKMVNLAGDPRPYLKNNFSTLSSTSFHDTAFLITNAAGILTKITLKNGIPSACGKIDAGAFINTVSVNRNTLWVNTTHRSFALNSPNQQITGNNISDMLTDQEGNTWYSSLTNGLLVNYKNSVDAPLPIAIAGGDNVTYIDVHKGKLVAGTQNGHVIIYDPTRKRVIKDIELPGRPKIIDYIYNVNNDRYLVGTSIDTYLVDIANDNVKLFEDVQSLKEADVSPQFVLMASAKGLYICPSGDSGAARKALANEFKGINYTPSKNGGYFRYRKRCRAVCYDSENKLIYVAFKDGLYTIGRNGVKPFLYNNTPVYANSLLYTAGKVTIATTSNGILITGKTGITHIGVNDGLSSNIVLTLKKGENNGIWLFGAGATMMLDPQNGTLSHNYNLSQMAEMQVSDIATVNNTAYVSTPDGLYMAQLNNNTEKLKIRNYMQAVFVNNTEINNRHDNNFQYFENNIRFDMAVPFYYHASAVYFKYRLTGSNNQNWQTTKAGDRSILFSALEPGKYNFKAYAVHPQFGKAIETINYNFIINEQWWQTWWFKILVSLFFLCLISFILIRYFLNRLQFQKILYESKLTLNNERQRISSEMHDEVGASLSAIKLLVNIAGDDENEDMTSIKEMVNDLSKNISEIIWSTNVHNDTLESLLYYIETQAFKLYEHAGIALETSFPPEIPYYMITGKNRRNIYLLVIEFLHNALKHAKASKIFLGVFIARNEINITIKDNGKGFDHSINNNKGMGLKNADARVKLLNCHMHIVSDSTGTTVHLKIPLNQQ